MSIKKIWRKTFYPHKSIFKILDTSLTNLPKIGLRDIQNGEVDALIIRDFISISECKYLVEKLRLQNKNFESEKHPIFPYNYSQINQNSKDYNTEMKDYFNKSSVFFDTFSSIYEIDLFKKLNSVFQKLNLDIPASTVNGFENKGIYIPGTFRIQQPEKVNINLHCGNQFLELFQRHYEHLSQSVKIIDQLSYFIMLQEPDEGGRIIMYNISWDEAQECDTIKNTITTLKGKTINLNKSRKINSYKLKVKTGDLLVFSGGQIWHAVEQVKGITKRITFGGFLGFGKENNTSKVFWWS